MLKQLLFSSFLTTTLVIGGAAGALAETPTTSNTQTYSETREYQMPQDPLATQEIEAKITGDKVISGEVVNISGRDLMVQTEDGITTLNTLDLTLDPTGEYVTPSIEQGDEIQVLASLEGNDGFVRLEEITAVKKSYSSKVHHGQQPTDEGKEFLAAQQKAEQQDQTE